MVSNAVRQTISKANQYPHITRIGIFGSYARNEQVETSDLDILIDYDDCTDEFMNNLGEFMEDMELVFSGKIDYVTVPGLMDSKDERFRRNVLNDVIWLYTTKEKKLENIQTTK